MVITPSQPMNTEIEPAPVLPDSKNITDFVKVVTNVITPDEIKYVADIKDISDECEECGCTDEECADVIYITKIIAFADKFRVLHWAAKNHSIHVVIDDFCDAMEKYKDEVAENIQAITGQFDAKNVYFKKIELPVGDNPLEIINQLKICVQNWFELHADDKEYEGCRNTTSEFLQTIYKTVYLLRIAKND